MSSSAVTSAVSGGCDGHEYHERGIRIIDPGEFDNYEDYEDAYISEDDIKYLQVK